MVVSGLCIASNNIASFHRTVSEGSISNDILELVILICEQFFFIICNLIYGDKYNAIYGSFAALPLFLVWLQMSWLIVLFGAELLFSIKNERAYEFKSDCSRISYRLKKTIMLQVVHFLVKSFCRGAPPVTLTQILAELKVPESLAEQILEETTAAGIISEVCSKEGSPRAYQPAQDVNLFTVKYVIDKLERQGMDDVPMLSGPDFEKIKESVNRLDEFATKASANVLLKEV